MAGTITDNRNGTITAKMGKAISGECNAALTGDNTNMTVRGAMELRYQIETVFEKAAHIMTADEVIQNRNMCKAWENGKHTVGEVYMVDGQPWNCYQAYDNDVYPDIVPGSAAWHTFNKPYHGTTPETALPFVAPTHAEDIYKAGEYMIWTDGVMKKCVLNTSYGPDNDQNAWESV